MIDQGEPNWDMVGLCRQSCEEGFKEASVGTVLQYLFFFLIVHFRAFIVQVRHYRT
jgi:hypothetical protein